MEHVIPSPDAWYKARLTQYGAGKSKTDAPYVWAQFEVEDLNEEEFRWSGTFGSEAARERSIGTLIKLGLKDNDVSKVAAGPDGGALDSQTIYSVKLESQEYNGKQRWEVKFVGRSTPKKFEDAATLSTLKGLSADVMAIRKKLGEPKKTDPGF
jgi:hypothetical protein